MLLSRNIWSVLPIILSDDFPSPLSPRPLFIFFAFRNLVPIRFSTCPMHSLFPSIILPPYGSTSQILLKVLLSPSPIYVVYFTPYLSSEFRNIFVIASISILPILPTYVVYRTLFVMFFILFAAIVNCLLLFNLL